MFHLWDLMESLLYLFVWFYIIVMNGGKKIIEINEEEFEVMMKYWHLMKELIKVQKEKIEILDRALGRR